ncbi:hypothetical protein GCM10017673_37520 [Streptosporangium violaceochromogenes]|nr:hypothetical protein GCM10017673_37520 [Streptosporangium violaceochromogenes]
MADATPTTASLDVYAGYAVLLHLQDAHPHLPLVVAVRHREPYPPSSTILDVVRSSAAYARHRVHYGRAWSLWATATPTGVYVGGYGAPGSGTHLCPAQAADPIHLPYADDAPAVVGAAYIERVREALYRMQSDLADARHEHEQRGDLAASCADEAGTTF